MICLREINEHNWLEVARLKIQEEQQKFVAPPIGILARAYVYRKNRAAAYAIYNDETVVGVLMVRDLDEEPACYELQQWIIGEQYQGQGFGQAALREIIAVLRKEGKYQSIEVCVKMEDQTAVHVYQKAGFVDTGYLDPDAPDCYNLVYRFDE